MPVEKHTAVEVQRWLDILAESESVGEAIGKIGLPERSIYNAIRRHTGGSPAGFLRPRLVRRGAKPPRVSDTEPCPPPEGDGFLPEGQRLAGKSTLVRNGVEVGAWYKGERTPDEPPAVDPEPAGHHLVSVSAMRGRQGESLVTWTRYEADKAKREELFWAACKAHVEEYRGEAPPVSVTDEPASPRLMSVYPLGDPHVGMLAWAREAGESFDLKIAERGLVHVIDRLATLAPLSERALIVDVGDFFHADGDLWKTPAHGNPLDGDGRMTKVAQVGFGIFRRLVDRLLLKHMHVEAIITPGNHDPHMSQMLALWLAAVYEREPRVTVHDSANPYTYVRHGQVLLGVTHGDGPAPAALPGIMATDRPQDWGETRWRHWLTGHIHHKTRHEFPGCTSESFNTLASRDAWHNKQGYRAEQYLQCITYDLDDGEINRATVPLPKATAA